MSYVTNTALATLILASGVLSPLMRADDVPVDSKLGTTVTITGCLHAATHEGRFVLVGVVEKTATGAVPVPFAIYRLDHLGPMKEMTPLVGELVDVTGKVTKRDTAPGIIKVDVGDDAEHTTNVEVENGNGSKGVTTKDYAGARDASGSMVELSRPIYHLDVETVTAVSVPAYGPACK